VSEQKVATYSDCGEDILELVYEGNQPRIVHVDAVDMLAFRIARGYPRHVRTHSDSSPWLAMYEVDLYKCVRYSCEKEYMGVGVIERVEGESV
jgi:hypothetical protein